MTRHPRCEGCECPDCDGRDVVRVMLGSIPGCMLLLFGRDVDDGAGGRWLVLSTVILASAIYYGLRGRAWRHWRRKGLR